MSKSAMQFGKGMTLMLWLLVVAALIGYIPSPFNSLILYFGAFVFVVHVFEVFTLMTKYRDKVNSAVSDCINVMLYGVFHLQPLISQPSTESN